MNTSQEVLDAYTRFMRTSKFSEQTIEDRCMLLGRLQKFLEGTSLLDASPAQLVSFQESFATLSRSSVDIYTRHVRALYAWLCDAGHLASNPTMRMARIKPKQGVPHPISDEDLKVLLACSQGGLRLAYVLAAFAGFRAGEVCRLRAEDVRLTALQPTALIHGKGGRQRIVPLLPPVVEELQGPGVPTQGHLALNNARRPYRPEYLSKESSLHMKELRIKSSLHSCRHYFATQVVKLTRDVLLVRDLLGHASLQTTQIYMQSSVDDADTRLAELSSTAALLLS